VLRGELEAAEQELCAPVELAGGEELAGAGEGVGVGHGNVLKDAAII
jgi:hypothetical protein